jgi:hypothetical protein
MRVRTGRFEKLRSGDLPSCSLWPAPAPAAHRPPGPFDHDAPAVLHRCALGPRLHRLLPRPAPLCLAASRASDALHFQASSLVTLLLVRPFALSLSPHRPATGTTTASADFSLRLLHRRPFRHKARSPQVRTQSFPAQPPHLRHFALTTKASPFPAGSPCSAAPHMRFLFIGSRVRYMLPPHARSPSRSCISLRSRWSARARTFTS